MSQQPSVHQLYQRLETIGKGAYGSVHKGKHIPTGNIVGIKIINLDTPDDDVEDIQREVALLTQLRDAPNIIKYYGCYMDGPRVWIVMEYAEGGGVLSLMKASVNGCLEEKYVSVIIREVLVGLSYLHKVPIIHRDIKAANILVTATGKVLICDFGVSALLATTSSKRNTLTGTPYWMAPEVVQSVPVYDTKADIWSLGIMIYEMIKGTPPHSNLDKFKVMDIIPRTKPPRLSEQEGTKDMRDFMALCLRELPIERLPADELMKTKWIKSISKVPNSILKDLILRLQNAGPRDSLAGPLDWEQDYLAEFGEKEDQTWEFDTVRGRSVASDYNNLLNPLSDHAHEQTTIRAHQPLVLPSSLRTLFDDGKPSQSAASAPSQLAFAQSSSLYVSSKEQPQITGPASNTTLQYEISESLDESSTFAFPPRALMGPPNVPGQDSKPSSTTEAQYNSLAESPTSMDLALPAAELINKSQEITSNIFTEAPPTIGPLRMGVNRKRSQSTCEKLGTSQIQTDQYPIPSGAFQFPQAPKHSITTSNLPKATKGQQEIEPVSVDHSPRSNTHVAGHQAAYSLDVSSAKRLAVMDSVAPLPITRTRSATALPSNSNPERDEPLSFKANMHPEPLMSPSPSRKLYSRSISEKGGPEGSSSHPSNSLGTPGLKDVLKIPALSLEYHVGMKDLLPPSPSVAVTNRNFSFVPSSLSSSIPSSNDSGREHTNFREPGTALGSVAMHSHIRTRPAQTKALPHYRENPSLSSTLPLVVSSLDYAGLIQSENAHTVLTNTIDDLVHWLSAVELGFNSLLDSSMTTTIEEEQESAPETENSLENSTEVLHI